ncbi:MAG: hypothetical protein K2X44_11340, partial [Magnetospirillum sp.]|nr:hypothetical protein [Magnetospirillum sp.]
WLTRTNSWVLKLAKQTPKPVIPMAEAPKAETLPPVEAPADKPVPPVSLSMGAHHMSQPPAMAPASPPPPPPAAVAAPKADPRTLVYLASYKTEKAAKDGFKILAKASPILAKQQPVTQSIDLGKKGTWIRLYGLASDTAERTKICSQLGKRVDECGARNRE